MLKGRTPGPEAADGRAGWGSSTISQIMANGQGEMLCVAFRPPVVASICEQKERGRELPALLATADRAL
jgi:hypothetical protein